MYQRSNVLGKWDVILVSPTGKRFRSKSDLKVYLESQGLSYNPDIYDFSIHRRRAKDINAYVYTHDYSPQQPVKPKSLDVSQEASHSTSLDSNTSNLVSTTASTPILTSTVRRSGADDSQYMETPVATLVPPAELMSPTPQARPTETLPPTTPMGESNSGLVLKDGYGEFSLSAMKTMTCL